MSKLIIDEYTYRTDLSEKQKYSRRYPDRIKEQYRKESIKIKTPEGRARHNKRLRKWRAENPDAISNYNFKQRLKRFGLTEEQYYKFLEDQNNSCAICETTDSGVKDWAIDHCHDTQKVRGLLCINCNTAIGSLKEDPRIFKSALIYLEKHI